MDCKQSGNMFVLRRTFAEAKPQRLCKGSLPQNRHVPRSRAQRVRIKPKTDPIPVVFHNLRGFDAHHLMQAMSQLQKEIKCIANNMEKYITFSIGGLSFIDSLNFLQGSLESLVSATPKESLKITPTIPKGSELLYKKGIYPYEYMDSWERFGETRLLEKDKFYSEVNDEHITDERVRARAESRTFWMQKAGRLPRSLRENGRCTAGGCF